MTQRVVSVWLSHWRTDRIERKRDLQEQLKPRVIYHPQHGGDRIIALNKLAEQEGIRSGLRLTDAKAIYPSLKAIECDPVGEAQELEYLAYWCMRFSPLVSIAPPDGLWLDVTGVTHLFGGELAYLQNLKQVLQNLQLNSRLALADTPGAAWGFARYGKDQISIIPPKQQKSAGKILPVNALRLNEKDIQHLKHLGLKRVGHLYKISPISFRPRFGKRLLQRLEQFKTPGREVLSPLVPEPDYYVSMGFAEPLGHLSDIQLGLRHMVEQVTQKLIYDGKGASCFQLVLYGMHGKYYALDIRASQPTKDKDHILLLFKERLTALENRFDPSFDIDRLSLSATQIAVLETIQNPLTDNTISTAETHLLIDRLVARLGRNAVKTYQFQESHIPEKAVIYKAPNSVTEKVDIPQKKRPILLLSKPEAIKAIAEVPDYPPRRFEWRYRLYHVVKAEGPERITDEWWHDYPKKPSRDYYRVEDKTGACFWLYREGIYQRETNTPKWYMHGIFA